MQVRLSNTEKEWLIKESQNTGKTVCSIIREIIDKHINNNIVALKEDAPEQQRRSLEVYNRHKR